MLTNAHYFLRVNGSLGPYTWESVIGNSSGQFQEIVRTSLALVFKVWGFISRKFFFLAVNTHTDVNETLQGLWKHTEGSPSQWDRMWTTWLRGVCSTTGVFLCMFILRERGIYFKALELSQCQKTAGVFKGKWGKGTVSSSFSFFPSPLLPSFFPPFLLSLPPYYFSTFFFTNLFKSLFPYVLFLPKSLYYLSR